MIVIVDYGLGNLGSIKNMLRKLGYDSVISSEKKVIEEASKIILPGVGSFDTGMSNLIEKDLIEVLNKKALVEKIPVLGICLGVQLMCNKSEEGIKEGLGWFDAEVLSFKGKFEIGLELPVPNMGWLDVNVEHESKLTSNLPNDSRFYFVHSFFINANKKEDIQFTTKYGFSYVSGLHNENIYGVQFHPEKSHKFGFQLLKNFADI
jgi:glutamine amidotransferase